MENNQFTINGFFNNLPIRIIGTPEEPFFYASDIGDILGIKQISTSIKNFDETEIVTPEIRQRYNLITYQKYKNELRRNDAVMLLTEQGVYRLILCTRSDIAKDFKNYIYKLIKDSRSLEKRKLVVIPQNDVKILQDRLRTLENERAEYQKYNPTIHVFYKEISDNPYNHIPNNEADKEFATEYDGQCEKIYKFTTKPTAEDFTHWSLHSKIYGDTEQIMDELFDGALEINSTALKHHRYHDNFDFEITYGRVVYQ
ncbi:BRO N-terminal domain-containing prophage antirepressor [Pacmanvirus A23]|uniref:BRO N-terminal domain-containing prophage antirepressor n=1 Tax=Pacmanvirus A23 TaxID=1932881 RepID=UPI000A092DC5|nr:BRO N-terminal domain-containing prophage antirepressor [Pacmanvirus A23]SIP85821.1 BRO N-terminal domain-containing prophage antirepressor [Pacmanvirus A23]